MEQEAVKILIESAKNKDQKSQTKLINLYWVDVFYFVMKKVNNQTIADEITINIFSKVLAKIDSYNSNFAFKNWVLTIAQNTIIDYWRKNQKENQDNQNYLKNIDTSFEKSPEDLLISMEEEKKIQQIMTSMDTSYQEILKLRFLEEMSIKEISEKLNLSLSNTKVKIMRAKKLFADLLKKNNFHL